MCIGLDVQRGVHVETMRRMGERTAPEDFDTEALSTEVAPPEARRLFLIFIWLKYLLARSDKQLNDEQIELLPHDYR